MKFENIQGSIVAMVTPFHEDGSVNFEVLTNLGAPDRRGHRRHFTLGTTGEYPTMTHEEDAAVVEHTIRVVNGRVPVMVGSGSNCTATQIEKSIQYQDMGADALLLIAPYYNKANAEGMYRHFAETADKVHIPCILYNVPGRTGCSIPVGVVERLSEASQHRRHQGGQRRYVLRHEDRPLRGPDFASTPATTTSPSPLMSVGGSGVISVYANVMPAMCHRLWRTIWAATRPEQWRTI
ncbi:MAG: dihydrodipicolinate synthase family protein [Oscillospiraceae bacterium]